MSSTQERRPDGYVQELAGYTAQWICGWCGAHRRTEVITQARSELAEHLRHVHPSGELWTEGTDVRRLLPSR
jgi:hypothetical protein